MFHLFCHKIFFLSIKSREIGKSIGDVKTRSKQPKGSTQISIFKTDNFSVDAGLQFCFEVGRIIPTNEYRKLPKWRKLSPKSVILLKVGGNAYSLCQDACECVFLFQTSINNAKFTKCPARFKGESNRNLNEDFTISVEDAICIALSKQDNYCRSRQCITSEETVMQLLFYHY